jgi:hypothetical protein
MPAEVERLTDKKIQDGCRFKGKLQNSPIIHTARLLWCQMLYFQVKEFIKMIIGCGETK